jgi:hypothetical protein
MESSKINYLIDTHVSKWPRYYYYGNKLCNITTGFGVLFRVLTFLRLYMIICCVPLLVLRVLLLMTPIKSGWVIPVTSYGLELVELIHSYLTKWYLTLPGFMHSIVVHIPLAWGGGRGRGNLQTTPHSSPPDEVFWMVLTSN